MSLRSLFLPFVLGLAIIAGIQSVCAANHSLRLLGRVTGIQSINGALEGRVRVNDPYVLTLSYDPAAPVDHDSNSGDARNGIGLSISLQAVYLNSPSWAVANLNDPEGALIIENNSLATTGTRFDSIRALATLENDLGDSFPVDSVDADPQFGRFEVEVGGQFISQVEQLPTTLDILKFIDSAIAEVSLNGDYLVRFGFDKLTGDSSIVGDPPALKIPGLVMNQVISSGSNFFANLGTDSSVVGAGYRLEGSRDMITWEPRHLFIGNGSALRSNSSFGGGRFFRLVANGRELEQLALGQRERDEDGE